jgi:tetratricopeptide (TPR) repeat protein
VFLFFDALEGSSKTTRDQLIRFLNAAGPGCVCVCMSREKFDNLAPLELPGLTPDDAHRLLELCGIADQDVRAKIMQVVGYLPLCLELAAKSFDRYDAHSVEQQLNQLITLVEDQPDKRALFVKQFLSERYLKRLKDAAQNDKLAANERLFYNRLHEILFYGSVLERYEDADLCATIFGRRSGPYDDIFPPASDRNAFIELFGKVLEVTFIKNRELHPVLRQSARSKLYSLSEDGFTRMHELAFNYFRDERKYRLQHLYHGIYLGQMLPLYKEFRHSCKSGSSDRARRMLGWLKPYSYQPEGTELWASLFEAIYALEIEKHKQQQLKYLDMVLLEEVRLFGVKTHVLRQPQTLPGELRRVLRETIHEWKVDIPKQNTHWAMYLWLLEDGEDYNQARAWLYLWLSWVKSNDSYSTALGLTAIQERYLQAEEDSLSAADLHRERSYILYILGRMDQALGSLDQAEQIYRLHSQHAQIGSMLYWKGATLQLLNRDEEALAAHEAAKEAFMQVNDMEQVARVLVTRSQVLYLCDREAEAIADLDEAERIYREQDNQSELCIVTYHRARILYIGKEYDSALELLETAEQGLDHISARLHIFHASRLRGAIYSRIGAGTWPKAVAAYTTAIAGYRMMDNYHDAAAASIELAQVYYFMDDIAAAKQTLREAIVYTQRMSDNLQAALFERIDQAEQMINSSIQLAISVNAQQPIAQIGTLPQQQALGSPLLQEATTVISSPSNGSNGHSYSTGKGGAAHARSSNDHSHRDKYGDGARPVLQNRHRGTGKAGRRRSR